MGIFNLFQKKGEKPKEINRIDELANKLMKEGKISLLGEELQKIKNKSLSDKEKETWYEMYGIEAFRRNDRHEALTRFIDAYAKYPNSPSIAFSLGQEYEYLGNISKMIELFDKVSFPKVSARHVICAARYCYLWDRYDKSIQYLTEFFKYFYDLGVVDDTFLYLRGLPFFGEVWASLGTSYELTNNLVEFMRITQESKSKLRDYPFDSLIDSLECIQSNNFDRLLQENIKKVDECRKNKLPAGYSLMKVAVLKSFIANNYAEAEKVLDEVDIGNDFPWLNDMRLLAKCSLANRLGDVEKENKLKIEFLTKQSLLFEPEHIFNFRLIFYQEKLKKEYQNRVKARLSSD